MSKVVSPNYDYVREFDFVEIKVNDYKYKQEIDGTWNVMNSKGTNRILTDEFQAYRFILIIIQVSHSLI